MLNLAIICGGPSKERGISLNSARSFLDHSESLGLQLTVLYVDLQKNYYQLTKGQLYSNTPSDFDFKLAQTSIPLDEGKVVALLRKMDLVFPIIHGIYGEDGELQAFLEKHGIPFAGSPSAVCKRGFNKFQMRKFLTEKGFPALPFLPIHSPEDSVAKFWKENHLSHAIVKPTLSGSSIGVQLADSIEAAQSAIRDLWKEGFRELLVEPYCEDTEFTVCVLENKEGKPVSLLPLEIDIGKEGILNYRMKYLPTDRKRYFCPPRFDDGIVEQIRKEAERLFRVLGLRNFARIDGWVSKEGTVRFSDLNPISGMEQNSFIFQQSSRIGISHSELIQYVLEGALRKVGKSAHFQPMLPGTGRKALHILMGGITSERHVSLMTGTNVWLKFLPSKEFASVPFLLTQEETVWELPYGFTLHHSVEEMVERCREARQLIPRVLPMAQKIRQELGLSPLDSLPMPREMKLDAFIQEAKAKDAFVFIGLHGGMGEDGRLQKRLEEAGVPFNGSGSATSSLCMDKHRTARCIQEMKDPDVAALQQVSFNASSFFQKTEEQIGNLWQIAALQLGSHDLIVKPQCDGCSTGVVRLRSAKEFGSYIYCLRDKIRHVPKGTFKDQQAIVEMPVATDQPFLLEPFIETDKIQIQGNELSHKSISGWCEMTIGVLENEGHYHAFHPSLTVAESHVLSVEEKFQGGTGINITPPPKDLLSEAACRQVQEGVTRAAKQLGIKNYARLDIFVHLATGKIRIIEANTLPALTPSTVLYHQALSETPPLIPRDLLSKFVKTLIKS